MFFSKTKGKFEKKEKTRLPLSVALIYFTVVSLLFAGVGFAKFSSTITMESDARVAVMAAGISMADLQIDGAPTGEVQRAVVTISNYVTVGTQKKVCEVSLSCEPEPVNVTGNIPLQLSLFEDENFTIPAKPVVFNAGEASEKTYYLKILWPLDDRDSAYAFEIDAVRVIVTATQID